MHTSMHAQTHTHTHTHPRLSAPEVWRNGTDSVNLPNVTSAACWETSVKLITLFVWMLWNHVDCWGVNELCYVQFCCVYIKLTTVFKCLVRRNVTLHYNICLLVQLIHTLKITTNNSSHIRMLKHSKFLYLDGCSFYGGTGTFSQEI